MLKLVKIMKKCYKYSNIVFELSKKNNATNIVTYFFKLVKTMEKCYKYSKIFSKASKIHRKYCHGKNGTIILIYFVNLLKFMENNTIF